MESSLEKPQHSARVAKTASEILAQCHRITRLAHPVAWKLSPKSTKHIHRPSNKADVPSCVQTRPPFALVSDRQ